MSGHYWHVSHHDIPASHIRGSERGVRDNRKPWLRLAVKHYVPRSLPSDCDGFFTIIMAGGIGSAKETYEPFFDDLLAAGLPIRGIWIADLAGQFQGYLVNKDSYGDEPSWTDYSRDIWTFINHFQTEMPPPLLGIGQSLGCGNIMQVSSWHPRLFSGIVALEPGLGPSKAARWPAPPKYFPGVVASKRKDKWASREDARRHLRKTQYFARFDPRVFENVVRYELQDVEDQHRRFAKGALDGSASAVTLTTPRHIEAYHWMIPDPPLPGHKPTPGSNQEKAAKEVVPGFHRADAAYFYQALPMVRPPVLLVWANKSPISPQSVRERYMDTIGSGLGGNGGVATGAVQQTEVLDAAHPVCLEKPKAVAAAIAPWAKRLHEAVVKDFDSRPSQLPFRDDIHPEITARIAKL